MCVIAYKPMNVDFMSKSVLQECFNNNPDGAGFMFTANGEVHIKKGYMNFNAFWKALKEVRNQYGEKIPYVMHFRISTQAGVNQQCCHPYPLSRNMDRLKQLDTTSKVGIAHNGIISLTTDRNAKGYNDTMKFITDYATLLIKKVNYWTNPNVAKALKELCGSKLAILGSDNHCELIGDFIKDNGCYYSNATYCKPKFTTVNSSVSWYDDDWEFFYNKKSKKYEFDETYCPLVFNGDNSYCSKCARCNMCATLDSCKEDFAYQDELSRYDSWFKQISNRA